MGQGVRNRKKSLWLTNSWGDFKPLYKLTDYNSRGRIPPAPELIYIQCHFMLAFIRPIRSNLKYAVWGPVGNPEHLQASSH